MQGLKFTYLDDGEYIVRVREYGHYPDRNMSEHYVFGPPRLNITYASDMLQNEQTSQTRVTKCQGVKGVKGNRIGMNRFMFV